MRGWRLILVAVTAALLAAGMLVLLSDDSDRGSVAAAGSAGGPVGTVERRTLTERLTASGTIGYAGEVTVSVRLGGTVTALPAVGDVIGRGERLLGLDGKPVALMYGAVPAYRTFGQGVGEGEDVEQLERNLRALGYEPGGVDRDFTYATAAAVAAWQRDLGLEGTGEVELGRVAFLPGPRRVSGIHVLLGEALGAGSSGESGDAASEAPSIAALSTTSTRRVVGVDLSADRQSIARRGQRVEVVLPDGSEVPGQVRRLAAVAPAAAAAGEGDGTEAGVRATVAVTGGNRIPALDGATVSVRFTQRRREDVLSVPLTALLAIGGGRFAVLAEGGGERRRIVVSPGLAADGFVEVEGDGLREGMRVEVGG